MGYKVKIKPKYVGSKILFNEINDFIEEGITNIGVRWTSDVHRESFVELIEDWMEELIDENKIQQYNIICDHRNNPQSEMDAGKFRLTVTYKQTHALNTTHLDYEIYKDDSYKDDMLTFYVSVSP